MSATAPHVIPVGCDEPAHKAAEDCRCNPFYDGEVCVHHSKDGREVRERRGVYTDAESLWVVVIGQVHNAKLSDGGKVQ